MNIKKELRKRLNEGKETPKTFDEAVDMEKLEMFAKGLLLICFGEYGYTYINKEEMKIGIVLGDANPFGDWKELEDWVRWECVDGPHEFIEDFDIEVDGEWQPSGEGWEMFDGKKWK
jgi:hypothetical protein